MKKFLLWIVVLALGFGAFSVINDYLYDRSPQQAELVTEPLPGPQTRHEPGSRYPVAVPPAQVEAEEAPPGAEPEEPPPLPGIETGKIENVLAGLFAHQRLSELLHLDHFIPRLVVTIDNLPGDQLPSKFLPVKAPDGRFLVVGGEGREEISAANSRRYTPYVRLAESVDARTMVRVYRHFYPLFQRAYADLGYPSGRFNDRLLAVVDHLLATPDIQEPVSLARPAVLYQFADAEIEALSAGQKLLIRSGPANATRIKTLLRDFRKELQAPQRLKNLKG